MIFCAFGVINRNHIEVCCRFKAVSKMSGEKVSEVIITTNRHTEMLKMLAYKSIDIEARSHRNNLIFLGLVENTVKTALT